MAASPTFFTAANPNRIAGGHGGLEDEAQASDEQGIAPDNEDG